MVTLGAQISFLCLCLYAYLGTRKWGDISNPNWNVYIWVQYTGEVPPKWVAGRADHSSGNEVMVLKINSGTISWTQEHGRKLRGEKNLDPHLRNDKPRKAEMPWVWVGPALFQNSVALSCPSYFGREQPKLSLVFMLDNALRVPQEWGFGSNSCKSVWWDPEWLTSAGLSGPVRWWKVSEGKQISSSSTLRWLRQLELV